MNFQFSFENDSENKNNFDNNINDKSNLFSNFDKFNSYIVQLIRFLNPFKLYNIFYLMHTFKTFPSNQVLNESKIVYFSNNHKCFQQQSMIPTTYNVNYYLAILTIMHHKEKGYILDEYSGVIVDLKQFNQFFSTIDHIKNLILNIFIIIGFHLTFIAISSIIYGVIANLLIPMERSISKLLRYIFILLIFIIVTINMSSL